MKKIEKKKKDCTCRPEWMTVLDIMVAQDQNLLFRICRKMIIHLNRIYVPEILDVMEELNPSQASQREVQDVGPNWPKPKGHPFIARDIYEKIFDIANKYIEDTEITRLLKIWIQQEKLSVLSRVLERRHAPFAEVYDAVRKYLNLFDPEKIQTDDEIIGLRVSLIFRFLSENLTYINITKHYITIRKMSALLERVVSPTQGNGKLGGKSAGLILARNILQDRKKRNPILKDVYTPRSRFVTSDVLTEFLHYNALEEFTFTKYQTQEEIRQENDFLEYLFKNSLFPPDSVNGFMKILDDMEGKPVIVRSSSLLEDSFEGSFSGKYKSLFISNTGTKSERLAALTNAIAEVYASTFGPDPIEYRKERGLLDFREEMGILIQQVVGHKLGKYYMPSYAGVAFSHNELRWSTRIEREDGVVRLVAGLGTRAVDRTINDYPTLASPGKPNIRVNHSYNDVVKYSQRLVDVINLETCKFETIEFQELIDSTKGNIPGIEKMVSFDRKDIIIDPISMMADFAKEDCVITFNNLIEKTDFMKQLNAILQELQGAYNSPVDVEFASDGQKLFLLQCRPQSQFSEDQFVKIPKNIDPKTVLFTANQYVSSAISTGIDYIVYVDGEAYSALKTEEAMKTTGQIISLLNRRLPRRKFILMGPGRWGSKGDIKLGVPVMYSDINNTKMLIEIAWEKGGYTPELSFGTHFFQDLVEANIRYLPLYPDDETVVFKKDYFMNTENLLSKYVREIEGFEDVVKVIKVKTNGEDKSLSVYMDGSISQAIGFIK